MAGSFGKRGVAARSFTPQPAYAAAASASVPTPSAVPRPRSEPLRAPLATIGIIVVLAIVFAAEMRAAPVLYGSSPSSGALIAFGAVDGAMVLHNGEWWRLFTAPLLHANLSHLIGNVVVFGIIGFMLEPLIGGKWFTALYAAGALGGTLCSILLNEPDIPCVGASGAIMGVLGGAFLCGASHKAGPKGRKMQTWALRLMLPALIPLAADSHVDYAGHLGGVVAGLVAGVVLQMAWTKGEDRPALGDGAAGVGAIVLAVGIVSLVAFAQFGNVAAVAAATAPGMIPDEKLPRSNDVGTDQASDLVSRYPHDPRAHFFRGIAFLTKSHDLADAEEQFRQARDPQDLAAAHLDPAFDKMVTVLLALTIAYEGRQEEARSMAGALCPFAGEQMSDMYDMLQDKGVCPS
jgi:rhomboid protease GluP